MDIRVAAAIIKLLGRSDPRVRVILASMSTEYDRFMRTQMLEGVAGVRPDTWWKRGKKGLQQAEKYFLDRGYELDPRWFDMDSTVVYNIVMKEIQRALKRLNLSLDPYEVIHDYLMGLSIIDPEKLKKSRPVFEAGKNQAEAILSGRMSPNVAANRDLQGYMVRGIYTEANRQKKFESLPEDYDAPVPASDEEAGDFLLEIIFRQPQDSLGRKIRDFMRKTWAGTGRTEEVMNTWLDIVETEKRIPPKKEVAQRAGVLPQDLSQKYWPRAWRRVFDALWANQSLQAQLQKRYEMEGLPWFQQRPDPEILFSKKFRRRKASRSDRCEMNIKTARTVLKLLRAASIKDARFRVAARWILASMADDYDKMLRAQVLEGAAGVKVGTWFDKGQRGLDQARAWFADNGFSVQPEWFDKKYSGMYGILEMAIKATARTYSVPIEPFDILNSALMGLSFDGSESGLKRPPYEAGKNLGDKIKKGAETPKSVAGGKLKAYLGRKVVNEAKTIQKYHQQVPVGVEGEELEIADTEAEKREAGSYLMDLVLWSKDPLGKKIRDVMRRSWQGKGKTEDVMSAWLDIVVNQSRIPAKKEVAQVVGVQPTDLSQKYWPKGWKLFFDALWSNSSILGEIQQKFESNRIPWFQKKPDWADVIKKQKRKRRASDVMIERITTRWMEGKTDQEITRWFGQPSSYEEWANSAP